MEISIFVQRNLADHDRRIGNILHPHSGESSPQGRTREGTRESAPYRVTADPGRGKTIPGPQHIRK